MLDRILAPQPAQSAGLAASCCGQRLRGRPFGARSKVTPQSSQAPILGAGAASALRMRDSACLWARLQNRASARALLNSSPQRRYSHILGVRIF